MQYFSTLYPTIVFRGGLGALSVAMCLHKGWNVSPNKTGGWIIIQIDISQKYGRKT